MVRGFQRFQDFVESGEGIATNILADRLRHLQHCGVVEAEPDPKDGRRVNYRLTQKGIDLAPVMLELLIWGAQHEKTGAPSAVVAHMAANREAILVETRRRSSLPLLLEVRYAQSGMPSRRRSIPDPFRMPMVPA